jgi:uncharacterized protein YegP (UPF0339 family)
MGSFVIHQRGEKSYYAALHDVNGDVILRGAVCDNLTDCNNSIDAIRANAIDFSKYELTDSHEGKFFFELKGSDGKDVARSVIFETPDNVYTGIESVIRNIPTANIDDSAFIA